MTKVTIYTRAFCGYCSRAMALLQSKDVELEEIDTTMDAEKHTEMLVRAQGQKTVPQIFVGDTHIGGCTELLTLEAEGRLDPLLEQGTPA